MFRLGWIACRDRLLMRGVPLLALAILCR